MERSTFTQMDRGCSCLSLYLEIDAERQKKEENENLNLRFSNIVQGRVDSLAVIYSISVNVLYVFVASNRRM